MTYTIQKMSRKMIADELPQLAEIPHPPSELYIVGKLPSELPDGRAYIYLSVVGSRKYTEYGQQACHELIMGLRGYPVAVVSGLAYGIDQIAHRAAMMAKLPTIAIPGSGLSLSALYPRGHTQLAEEILYKGGCLLSEFPPETKAAPWTFPQRNRLMAGIARAVLIIEAEQKSGTLITARLATEYNRDVLVVPGSIYSASSVGANFLLRQGATPITCADDLLQALGLLEENKMLPFPKDLSPEEMEIVSLLTTAPLARDEVAHLLAAQFSRKPHEISATLSILEIKGLIEEKLGLLQLKK